MICLIVDSSALPDSEYGESSACCKNERDCNRVIIGWLYLLMALLVNCKGLIIYPEEAKGELLKGLIRVSNAYRLSPPPHSSARNKLVPCHVQPQKTKLVKQGCRLKDKDSMYVALLMGVKDCVENFGLKCESYALVTCDRKMYACKERLRQPIYSIDELEKVVKIALEDEKVKI